MQLPVDDNISPSQYSALLCRINEVHTIIWPIFQRISRTVSMMTISSVPRSILQTICFLVPFRRGEFCSSSGLKDGDHIIHGHSFPFLIISIWRPVLVLMRFDANSMIILQSRDKDDRALCFKCHKVQNEAIPGGQNTIAREAGFRLKHL